MRWTEEQLAAYQIKQTKGKSVPEVRREILEAVISEKRLHQKIQQYCEEKNWIALHGSTAHRAMRTIGEWDFVILANQGRTFLIECKSKSGKATLEQLALAAHAKHLGHRAAIVRSYEEFLRAIILPDQSPPCSPVPPLPAGK